jgi:hypothetical protein
MTISRHASPTAIGRRLHGDYLPTLVKPLPSKIKGLVASSLRSSLVGENRPGDQWRFSNPRSCSRDCSRNQLGYQSETE